MDILTLAIAKSKSGSPNGTITTENITNALGYKPADQEEVSKLSEEITDIKENGTGGGTSNAVQYTEQTLTEEQQMQTRANLGLYSKRTVPSEELVYEYMYVGWFEGSGTLTGINKGIKYKISTPDADYECTSYGYENSQTGTGYAYIGNADLIPNKNEFVSYGGEYGINSIDCPVVLYQEIGGLDESIKVALDPNYSLGMGQTICFYQLGGMVDVIDTIPEEYLPPLTLKDEYGNSYTLTVNGEDGTLSVTLV